MVAYLEEAFGREHERTYGHRAGADEPVELVAIQVVGQGLREGAGRARARAIEPAGAACRRRRAASTSARSRLDGDAGRCAAPTWRTAAAGPADRRGVRRHLRGAAGRRAELDRAGCILIALKT